MGQIYHRFSICIDGYNADAPPAHMVLERIRVQKQKYDLDWPKLSYNSYYCRAIHHRHRKYCTTKPHHIIFLVYHMLMMHNKGYVPAPALDSSLGNSSGGTELISVRVVS